MSNNLTIETRQSYWANSARQFMIGPLDGYALYPIGVFMVHIRYWTLGMLCVVLTLNLWLSRNGFNIPVVARMMRTFLAGRTVRRRPHLGNKIIFR